MGLWRYSCVSIKTPCKAELEKVFGVGFWGFFLFVLVVGFFVVVWFWVLGVFFERYSKEVVFSLLLEPICAL